MKSKSKWYKATEINFRTPKQAKEQNTTSVLDIQSGKKMTPAEVKTMNQNPINEKHILAEFDRILNSLVETFELGTTEGERDLLRKGLFYKIQESKNISDLAKFAADEFFRGKALKKKFENNHNSIDYNFFFCFGAWCGKIGIIGTLVKNNLPLTAGIRKYKSDISRAKTSQKKRLAKSQTPREEYLKIWRDNPEIKTRKKNDLFYKWLSDNNIEDTFHRNTLPVWRKKAGLKQ